MEQTSLELGADIVVLSEIPRGPPDTTRWVSSTDSKATVALTSNLIMAPDDFSKGPGFASMRFTGLLVYSCYWSSGGSTEFFEAFLAELESDIRSRLCPDMDIIVAGDFNAKSPSWGSVATDARGRVLKRFAAALDLWPENVRSVPTFAVGDRSSVIDVTFARLPG